MEARGTIVACGSPRDSSATLIRSGSYTRRRWDDDLKNSEGSASTNRTPSYQRRLASAAKKNLYQTSIPHSVIRSLLHLDLMRLCIMRSTCIAWVLKPPFFFKIALIVVYQSSTVHFTWMISPEICMYMLPCTAAALRKPCKSAQRFSLSLLQSLLHDCTCPVRSLCR